MKISIGDAAYLYKELYALPGKDYRLDIVCDQLAKFIKEQTKDLEPFPDATSQQPEKEPTTPVPNSDDIPF